MDHNHDLPKTVPDSLPFQTRRCIPEELVDIAMPFAGFRPPHEIHNLLSRLALYREIPVTWTATDIRNRFPMLGGNLSNNWQTADLLETLSLHGRPFMKYIDKEEGVVTNLIWMQHNGDMDVALSACQCVIFDNTFNTNCLGYKFGVFSTVDREGFTRLVACTMMLKETREAFVWVLMAFAKLLGQEPAVILTDGDLWLGEGIERQWLHSAHLLCTWHLSKNLMKHVKPCLRSHRVGDSPTPWTTFLRMWWKICWNSDRACKESFDEEWDNLKAYLMDKADDPDAPCVQRALEYLGGPPSGHDDDDDEDSRAPLGGGAEEEEEEEDGHDFFGQISPDITEEEEVAITAAERFAHENGQSGAEGAAEASASVSAEEPPNVQSGAAEEPPNVQSGAEGAAESSASVSAEEPEQEESPHVFVGGVEGGEGDDVDDVDRLIEALRPYNMYDLRHKWASRFTSAHFTHGASSTQRGEGVFSTIKHFISAGCSLVSLYGQVEDMVQQGSTRHIERVVRQTLNARCVTATPLVQSLQELGCSPFVQQHAEFQISRANFYVHNQVDAHTWDVWHHSASHPASWGDLLHEADDEEEAELEMAGPTYDRSGHIRSHRVTLHNCSCQYPSRYGIFCAHMVTVYRAVGVTKVPDGVIAKAWLPRSAEQLEALQAHYLRTCVPCHPCDNPEYDSAQSLDAAGSQGRYRQCMDLGKLLAHAAEGSQRHYLPIVQQLQTLVQKHVRTYPSNLPHSVGAAGAGGAGGVGLGAGGGAPPADPPRAPGHKRRRQRTPGEKQRKGGGKGGGKGSGKGSAQPKKRQRGAAAAGAAAAAPAAAAPAAQAQAVAAAAAAAVAKAAAAASPAAATPTARTASAASARPRRGCPARVPAPEGPRSVTATEAFGPPLSAHPH